MSVAFRRALLGPLAAVVAAPGAMAAGVTRDAAPSGAHDLAAALTTYRAVMARKGEANGTDEANAAWCEEERAALDAITSAPAAGTADLLRKVLLLVDRHECGDALDWGLWEPEAGLLSGIGDEARELLAKLEGGFHG